MKLFPTALLGSAMLCSVAVAAAPGERAPVAPVTVDADTMDYRPLGVPPLAKAAGSLKPALDDAVFHPITVELRAEVHGDGSVHVFCDGGADHDHAAHSRLRDGHVDAEPQQ
jgi:hypothetical protein